MSSLEFSRVLFSFNPSDLADFRGSVDTILAGEADMWKEYLIGNEASDLRCSCHPGEDSIVRGEARRRRKFKKYYESVGKDDPLFIYCRPGSYVAA